MTEGFIKIHRSMTQWEWYKDATTKALFLHCLLMANWQDGRFQGVDIPRGSFVTSLKHLAEGSGLSIDQVRWALKKLESTGEILKKSTNKFSLITVVKYGDFQDYDADNPKQIPNKSQTNPKQIPTIEERKNKKKERIYKPSQATNLSERTYTDEMLEGLYKEMKEDK